MDELMLVLRRSRTTAFFDEMLLLTTVVAYSIKSRFEKYRMFP